MRDYYLKFDEQPEHADELKSSEGVLVDVIGPINGKGWHVNLRLDGDLPEELRYYEVFPEEPERVWL